MATLSEERLLQNLQHYREEIGLAPDPASDAIWARRIASGSHTMGDAIGRMQDKYDSEPSQRLNPGGQFHTPPGRPPANRMPGGNTGERLSDGIPETWDSGDRGDAGSTEMGSAVALIRAFLRNYDLEYSDSEIMEWAKTLSEDPNNINIIEEQIRQSDQFKARFPGLQMRVDNGFNQITVEQYLQLENQYKSLMRAAGLPRNFYDTPGDFARFIANDVSPAELEFRIERGITAAQNAPEEVKDALSNFYGIGDSIGSLAAYYLDPDKALPAIEQEFAVANISGAGAAQGFNQNQDLAQRLVSLGITEFSQGMQGFGRAAELRPLGVESISERDNIGDEDLVGAGFGVDQGAARRIDRRAQRRRADQAGQGAGGAGMSDRGSMLGTARRSR